MSINFTPLPTIFYPFSCRSNWHYWFKLSNGNFITKNYVSLPECIKMYLHCKKYSIPFKALPRDKQDSIGTEFALNTLLVLKRLNSNRSIEVSECQIKK